jgi:hypothetical protein
MSCILALCLASSNQFILLKGLLPILIGYCGKCDKNRGNVLEKKNRFSDSFASNILKISMICYDSTLKVKKIVHFPVENKFKKLVFTSK